MRSIALVLAALLLAGCESVTQTGAETVYRFAWWVPVGCVLGGVLMGAVGVVLLVGRLNARLGIMGIVLGGFVTVLIAPGTWSDRITLTPQGFSVRTGLWWRPTHCEVRFADLERIEVVRRGKRQHNLVCQLKDGRREVCPVSDLMKRGAEAAILAEADKQGVRVAK